MLLELKSKNHPLKIHIFRSPPPQNYATITGQKMGWFTTPSIHKTVALFKQSEKLTGRSLTHYESWMTKKHLSLIFVEFKLNIYMYFIMKNHLHVQIHSVMPHLERLQEWPLDSHRMSETHTSHHFAYLRVPLNPYESSTLIRGQAPKDEVTRFKELSLHAHEGCPLGDLLYKISYDWLMWSFSAIANLLSQL